ncbi:MAG TPA: nuclear transport factor 2 family protein [Rhodanobacteraceae bacterium]|nr:nuclear transport factor 2 family protein [Rhodanobacteraceae bacterium]
MSKLSLIGTLFLASLTAACYAQDSGTMTKDELVRLTQQRMHAVDAGDPKPFAEQFADDALIFDERGRSMDKAQLVKQITPLPKGDVGTLDVVNPASRRVGDTIVLSYDLNETETIFGQPNKARYHETDTWVKRNGKWQIIAEQVLRYYEDPAPGKADLGKYPLYLGTYQLGPDVTLTISREGSNLYAQEIGKKKLLLIPEAADIFFSKGMEGRELFKYDDHGKVVAYIQRRNNEDIVWKKLN